MSVIAHAVERHVTDKALNSSKGESILTEVTHTGETLLNQIQPWMIIVGSILLIAGVVMYSLAGKGSGSHAGREEVRRSYRRELAKQMARQDAEKIKSGEKVRRKWMQW